MHRHRRYEYLNINFNMSSAYGAIQRPTGSGSPAAAQHDAAVQHVLATINAAPAFQSANIAIVPVPQALPASSPLFAHLHALLNHEITQGNTYPQEHTLDANAFKAYFLSADAFVALRNVNPPLSLSAPGDESDPASWPAHLVKTHVAGTFYIKPNFPGRCSHVCNGGFIVSPSHRARNVGVAMALAFVRLAPAIGYRASMFNLVFVSNQASVKLWTRCGFKVIGRIPRVGRLALGDGDGNRD
ncbi:hypothetical protein BCR44DRAFT_1430889, partial [Catenaria anguillulae PL171]